MIAPGLRWRKHADGWTAAWVAEPASVRAGFRTRAQVVWTGILPTAAESEFIASECRLLESDMRRWAHAHGLGLEIRDRDYVPPPVKRQRATLPVARPDKIRNTPKIDGAPGLRWQARANHYVAYWICRADIAKRGYPIKTQRLWPPSADPRAELSEGDVNMLRSECIRLQNEMLAWSAGSTVAQLARPNTVKGLIDCYRRDPDSPYHELRFYSKRSYEAHLRLIEKKVGDRSLAAITGRDIKRWYENWREPAEPGGPRRTPRAHAAITMFRILISFGVGILEDTHCQRLRLVLEQLEFQQGRPRREEINATQATAIRRQAHTDGAPSIALAQAIQFELGLRPKDVIGEWIPVDEPGASDIHHAGMKWLYGLHWREVSPDLILTHRLSKSLRGRSAIADQAAGKVKRFDLRLYPMIMEELQHVPVEDRTGPLIKDERTGIPYSRDRFRHRWRAIATAAGIPATIQNRDSRAGAATESIEASGDINAARAALGHSSAETTMIYSRGDDRTTAKVAVLRQKKREEG